MTTEILIGVPITLEEDITYALPARACLCNVTLSGSSIEVSNDGSTWTAVTLTNGAFFTAAAFVHSLGGDSIIDCKPFVALAPDIAVDGTTIIISSNELVATGDYTGVNILGATLVTTGNITSAAIIKADSYKSGDGSTGMTGTVNTAVTPSLVIKDGLVISSS